jgi:hypothetical protein
MEPENSNQEEQEVAPVSQLHQVTPLSKYLALALFIIMPFLGGWIGYSYAPVELVEVGKVAPAPSSSPDYEISFDSESNNTANSNQPLFEINKEKEFSETDFTLLHSMDREKVKSFSVNTFNGFTYIVRYRDSDESILYHEGQEVFRTTKPLSTTLVMLAEGGLDYGYYTYGDESVLYYQGKEISFTGRLRGVYKQSDGELVLATIDPESENNLIGFYEGDPCYTIPFDELTATIQCGDDVVVERITNLQPRPIAWNNTLAYVSADESSLPKNFSSLNIEERYKAMFSTTTRYVVYVNKEPVSQGYLEVDNLSLDTETQKVFYTAKTETGDIAVYDYKQVGRAYDSIGSAAVIDGIFAFDAIQLKDGSDTAIEDYITVIDGQEVFYSSDIGRVFLSQFQIPNGVPAFADYDTETKTSYVQYGRSRIFERTGSVDVYSSDKKLIVRAPEGIYIEK